MAKSNLIGNVIVNAERCHLYEGFYIKAMEAGLFVLVSLKNVEMKTATARDISGMKLVTVESALAELNKLIALNPEPSEFQERCWRAVTILEICRDAKDGVSDANEILKSFETATAVLDAAR